MQITKNYGFSRRDFRADFKCEFCGHEEKEVWCYDDSYFHNTVIPNMICKSCGKHSKSSSSSARFPDYVQM
jgi:transcription elongation factor Elf1